MCIAISGLIAYPSSPEEIGQTILRFLERIKQNDHLNRLTSWEESDIPGRFIASEVLTSIENGSIFIADITRLNFNVVFEIGYAIGCKKRAFLVVNENIRLESDLIRQVGIFDTLGYEKYKDAISLSSVITSINDLTPNRFDANSTNSKAPVYLVLPQNKGDIETHLIARIKKARLFYRSFDPEEQGRLSALDAIENVASSYGVIIPLLPSYYVSAEIHNFRAAFVAGLAQGMQKELLLLQMGDEPIPLDYRDLVHRFKYPEQIDPYVAEFAVSLNERFQSTQPSIVSEPSTFLTRLNLGASSAENEFQELGSYYIETDEFRRTMRGEVQIVLGRKGAGKSALFFQLRDRLRSDKRNVVLDLKPEGFQLIKFKEQVLDYLAEGTQEHTITAFWEYLLLLEICHKLLQNDKDLHLRNHILFKPYQNLADSYKSDEYVSEGDFSERMLRLTQRIIKDFPAMGENPENRLRFSNEEITQYVYKHNIALLRSSLVSYLRNKQSLWILFDNLDKGWPPHGITFQDVLALRCLMDAMGKLERDFRRDNIPTQGIIFIRNDVYEILVSTTPDRGKISQVFVDWDDPAILLELLRRRFLSSEISGDPPFENIWRQICVSHLKNGEETAHYMVERCLMRPRSLIDLFRFCRSHAINLGHRRIEIEDIENGEEQYSTQLVNDIYYEIQDVYPPAKESLYELIECPAELDKSSLDSILTKISPDATIRDMIFNLLLWYGVIGFRRQNDEPTYIYSVRYDMKRLRTLLRKHEGEGCIYLINPAFWRGLEIKTKSQH
jgi:hypothetical protein